MKPSARFLAATDSLAARVAARFAASHHDKAPSTVAEYLPAKQTSALAATLGHRHALWKKSSTCDASGPGEASDIPPGWHLVYFYPVQTEDLLGRDGTDTSFNPPAPFTRRMWAGGEMVWGDRRLRVGETVHESTRLLGVEPKVTRAGEEMLVVKVEKKFRVGEEVALVDKRHWIFRPEITAPRAALAQPGRVPFPAAKYTRDLCQTNVSLFRFSALTFNGHKIHYCKEWCNSVEGHRDCVVHGPLNLINILNFWTDVYQQHPASIKYRATNPLYVGEPYRICMQEEEEENGETDIAVVDSYGVVCMTARVRRHV